MKEGGFDFPSHEGAKIRHAFHKCPDRFKVLKIFVDKENTYCGEICRISGISKRNVKGILRGNSDYAESLSFVAFRFIEEYDGGNDDRIREYRILDEGRKIYDALLKEGYR